MKHNWFVALGFCVLLSFTGRADSAVVFTKLIDSTTNYPSIGQFTAFNRAPTYDGNDIAFLATSSSGGDGIFRFSTATNQLQRVAGAGLAAPNSAQLFSSFGVPYINGGTVAFIGSSSSGLSGVYAQDSAASPLRRVIHNTQTLPTGSTPIAYSTFYRPTINGTGGVIAFMAGNGGVNGIFTSDAGGLHTIATQATAVPGRGTNFSFLERPAIDDAGSVIVFAGIGGSAGFGVYAWEGGAVRKIADDLTVMPGGQTFGLEGSTDRNFAVDGHTIQFYGLAKPSNKYTVYIQLPDLSMRRIYGWGDPMPGHPGATIGGTWDQEFAQGIGLYSLFGSDGSGGIFYGTGDANLIPVVERGPFDGKTLTDLRFAAGSLHNGTFVMKAEFSNGTKGLYLVTIPEPATATACAAILALASLRRRRRPVACAPH